MSTRIILAIMLIGCAFPVSAGEPVAEDAVAQASPGNPPRILLAEGINDADELQLVNYRTIYIGFQGDCYNHRTLKSTSLKDVQIFLLGDQPDADEELTLAAAREKLAGQETSILATSWRHSVPEMYRPLLKPGAMLFVFPKDAPEWEEIQDPTANVGKTP